MPAATSSAGRSAQPCFARHGQARARTVAARPILSMPCPNKPAILSTRSKPRATLSALPPPDGPPTCRSRREESLRVLAVTCGGTKEEAVHRHCSAGSRIGLNGFPLRGAPTGGSAKPATGEILAPCAGPRRPAAGAGVETGLWRAALRMRGGCLAHCQPPWRSRIANARPSPCRMKPDAVLSCPCPGDE